MRVPHLGLYNDPALNEIDRPPPNLARAARTHSGDPGRLFSAVRRAVEGLPRWRLATPEGDEVRAVRKTRLFGFEDDVTARVYPDPDGARLGLTSASRLDRGDLGQNPRNLEELLRAVDGVAEISTEPTRTPPPRWRGAAGWSRRRDPPFAAILQDPVVVPVI